jgi:hypothetical protein
MSLHATTTAHVLRDLNHFERQPTLIAAGPWREREFVAVRQAVDPQNAWPLAPSLREAVEKITLAETPPELVLLAQSRPGCDEQADVELLREVAPLTRVVVVAGSWCEGELRTGRPLAGVIRLYWHEFPAWWRACLACLARRESPPWAEPLNDVRAGQASCRVPARARVAVRTQISGAIVAIDATDFAVFETLAASLSAEGWKCVWQPRHRQSLIDSAALPVGGIWDGSQLHAAEAESLSAFSARMKRCEAKVVALLDVPRVEHIEMASKAGAATVLGKPFQVAHMYAEFERFTAAATGAD